MQYLIIHVHSFGLFVNLFLFYLVLFVCLFMCMYMVVGRSCVWYGLLLLGLQDCFSYENCLFT